MRGEPFLYPGAVRALMRDWLERVRRGETSIDGPLTPRETEIVKLIAEAHTTREIAADLVISEKTVERHRTNILAKLGMRDRVELVRYAIRRGLRRTDMGKNPPPNCGARRMPIKSRSRAINILTVDADLARARRRPSRRADRAAKPA